MCCQSYPKPQNWDVKLNCLLLVIIKAAPNIYFMFNKNQHIHIRGVHKHHSMASHQIKDREDGL
jgi:hypothetical protein